MIDGGITRAAIILLGKPVSVFKLRPAVVRVTWSLRDEHEDVIDYEHFTAPFILTVDQILAKVHNLTMREMPGGTMFPDVMQQYDDYSMREVLHNCIAHQDYTLQERINLVENPGFLYYANGGSFIPGSLQMALGETWANVVWRGGYGVPNDILAGRRWVVAGVFSMCAPCFFV